MPSKSLPEGFDKADHPLYHVALSVWRGFVFVNLAEDAAGSAQASFDPASGNLGNWPLETLVSGHVLRKVMNCNWKIFSEASTSACIAPATKDLSRLVPIYGRRPDGTGTTIPNGSATPTMTRRSFPAACAPVPRPGRATDRRMARSSPT